MMQNALPQPITSFCSKSVSKNTLERLFFIRYSVCSSTMGGGGGGGGVYSYIAWLLSAVHGLSFEISLFYNIISKFPKRDISWYGQNKIYEPPTPPQFNALLHSCIWGN